MIDKVLYFPYINVPSSEWFTRVLLYWDEVGSIVPSEYIEQPELLNRYTRELMEVELVKLVNPGKYIHEIPNFEGAFLDLINNNEFIMARRGIAVDREETFRIHIEKFSPLAFDLCDMGLARELEYPWYEVERTTCDLFMAYLASVLGKSKNLQMEPVTDRAESLSVFSSSPQNILEPSSLIDKLRITVLEGVLPAPAGGVQVRELANFKETHSGLLSRFRRHVESSLIETALISDRTLRERKILLIQGELKDGIEEIRALMHGRRWPRIVFGTLCGLIAAAIPGVPAVTTGNITSALTALPGLVKAIYSAFSGISVQKEISQFPLAYAALAQEHFA